MDSTELKLIVPKGVIVDISAVSADIDVSGLEKEKLTASSVNGDVEVKTTSQRVSIESVSGDVEFDGHTQRISAESVSGDMDLQTGIVESAKLETVLGDITVNGEISGNGKLRAESMSGDVVIYLPASQSGLFKAQSFSGRIYTDFGSVSHAKHGPGSHLKHVEGSGSAEVRVESFSGNIKLKHD